MKNLTIMLIGTWISLWLLSPSKAQTHISGPLSGVLVAETYLVDDSIYVQFEDSLAIEPGASLLFSGYFNFRIYGHLYAVGTEADSIFFVPAPAGDSLRSITFQAGSSDSSVMSYCYISGCAESAINIYSAHVTIAHCTITGNTANWGGGIYCSGSNSVISECVITDNVCRNNGGGIYCTNASPTITNCFVTGNLCNTLPTTSSGRGGGGICANHSASPIITGCIISGNHSIWNGGGLSFNDNSEVNISDCLIADNSCDSSGGGISIFVYCESQITNCTISGNAATLNGGGIYIYQSSPVIANTIVEGSEGNGGIFFELSPATSLLYSDLFNNEGGDLGGDTIPAGLGQLVNVNANGDSCDTYYNIFLNPLFANAGGGDFTLQAESPCIDAGDPSSPLDPDSTVADIGAFYFHQIVYAPGENQIPNSFALEGPYPNPFNPTTVASFELRVPSYISLRVYDTAGRLVATLVDGWREAGRHEVIFDPKGAGGSELASGIYIYRLEAGIFTANGKMVLMK